MRKKRVDYPELEKGREKLKELYTDGTRLDFLMSNTKNSRNKTGFSGVSFDKHANKYKATIGFKGKKYHIGLYDTPEEAAKARAEAKREMHEQYLLEFAKEHPKQFAELQKKKAQE